MSNERKTNGNGKWLWICLLIILLGLIGLAVKPTLQVINDRELFEKGDTYGEKGLFLKKLSLGFGERDLTPKLKNHPYLESLNLNRFKTDLAGLGRLPNLETLFLNVEAGTDLSSFPEQFPKLTDLGVAPVDDGACASMKDWPEAWRSQITTFNIREWYTDTPPLKDVGLTIEGVQSILEAFPNLTRLRLEGAQLSGKELLSVNIKKVDLSGKGPQIVPFKESTIGSLVLNGNELASGALASLAGSEVQTITLSYGQVENDEVFVGELLNIKGLKNAGLNGTNISTNQLRRLCREHPSLEHVYWFEMSASKDEKNRLKELVAQESNVKLR